MFNLEDWKEIAILGYDKNIIFFDSCCGTGYSTRLVSLMKSGTKRSMNLTDLFISDYASTYFHEIKNIKWPQKHWGVNIHPCSYLGEGFEIQKLLEVDYKISMPSSKVEICIGLDLMSKKFPTKEQIILGAM